MKVLFTGIITERELNLWYQSGFSGTVTGSRESQRACTSHHVLPGSMDKEGPTAESHILNLESETSEIRPHSTKSITNYCEDSNSLSRFLLK